MLFPATLMGGTLPVLSRALARPGHSGSELGLLYACNTLGSIGGVLLPDFLLIPRYGLTFTAFAAASCNGAVVVGMRFFATRDLLPASSSCPAPDVLRSAVQRKQQAVAVTLTACSGFAGM